MDPNLFHLDWDRLSEVLITIIVVAILLERALAVVFEHRLFLKYASEKGVKEFVAVGVAFVVCLVWHFDALSMILLTSKTTPFGELVTACIIAGGSKGSIRLFRDVMGIQSTAQKQLELARAAPPPAEAARTAAEAATTAAGAAMAAAKAATDAAQTATAAAQSGSQT